jgi:hypothetical protein
VVAIRPVLTTLASIIALLAAAVAVRAFRAIKTQTRLVIQEEMALWAQISWSGFGKPPFVATGDPIRA